jgi:hypothetical protein
MDSQSAAVDPDRDQAFGRPDGDVDSTGACIELNGADLDGVNFEGGVGRPAVEVEAPANVGVDMQVDGEMSAAEKAEITLLGDVELARA